MEIRTFGSNYGSNNVSKVMGQIMRSENSLKKINAVKECMVGNWMIRLLESRKHFRYDINVSTKYDNFTPPPNSFR